MVTDVYVNIIAGAPLNISLLNCLKVARTASVMHLEQLHNAGVCKIFSYENNNIGSIKKQHFPKACDMEH